jgi:NADH-quinone oxidoreductase subunit C
LSEEEREARRKAAAEARAARAAAQEGGAESAKAVGESGGDAAADARAARAAAARARKAEAESETEKPKEPSPNQPRLDRIVQLITEHVGEDAVVSSYINERDRHLPTLEIKNEKWLECANFVKTNEELKLDYLRNMSGVDYETHMEVVYHLLSFATKHDYCFKVKTGRESPSVPSVTGVWATANWNEREIYDLLGIDFPGHPDLRRIMLPDDWVGHPLRKDYEPLDPEV